MALQQFLVCGSSRMQAKGVLTVLLEYRLSILRYEFVRARKMMPADENAEEEIITDLQKKRQYRALDLVGLKELVAEAEDSFVSPAPYEKQIVQLRRIQGALKANDFGKAIQLLQAYRDKLYEDITNNPDSYGLGDMISEYGPEGANTLLYSELRMLEQYIEIFSVKPLTST